MTLTTEKQLQVEILKAFASRRDLRLWRANAGVAVPVHSDRVVRFGVRGQADLSGIIGAGPSRGRRLEIELKSPAGRSRREQIAFGAMINRFGGIYIVARSIEDVRVALVQAGLPAHAETGGAA